ncbi:MAG: flagellar motor switch protein FliM [Desulfocapsaceae bacterium]
MEPILSKQEIADLLQTLQKDGAVLSQQRSTKRYDLKSDHPEINLFELPTAIHQRSEIPNFNLIIEQFQSVFSRSLAQHLQRTVTIDTIEFQSIPFRDYMSVGDQYRPTGVLSLSPLSHGCLLTYDSHFWFLLLEILLGGVSTSNIASPDRSPTKLEMNLLNSSMELACRALDRALLPVMQVSSRLTETLNDPRLLSFTSPDSIVAVHRFEVHIDEAVGILELVFPLETLLPIREPLQKLTRLKSLSVKNWPDIIGDNLDSMPISVMAQSCSVDLSIQQLMDLKEGDFIPINREPESSVDVLVEGILKFSGTPGQHNLKRNVTITKVYQ